MMQPLWLSLQVATMATLLTTMLALALGAGLAHRRLWVLEALLTTPLVLPPTVLGYFLLVTFGRDSALGHAWGFVFGTPLVFSKAGIIFAAVITSLPMVLQATRAAIEGVDLTLVQAARTLGATPLQAFLRITLPLASRGIAAGVALGFARALGDFGVTLMVGGNLTGQTRTASLALYDAFIADRPGEALTLSLTMAAIGVTLVCLATILGRKPHVE